MHSSPPRPGCWGRSHVQSFILLVDRVAKVTTASMPVPQRGLPPAACCLCFPKEAHQQGDSSMEDISLTCPSVAKAVQNCD